MPNFDTGFTGERGPYQRTEGRGIDPAVLHDLAGQWNRIKTQSLNGDRYNFVLDSDGNKMYLARREQDNTIFLCSYRVPKNIKAERLSYKLRRGEEAKKTYMCAWLPDREATDEVRKEKVDIYQPHDGSAPYISEDMEGDYRVYANYEIGGLVLPVQREFMEKIVLNRREQLMALPENQRSEIMLALLNSYNTKIKVDRSKMVDDMLRKFGVEPISKPKMAKRG